jgi:hypothetical protein
MWGNGWLFIERFEKKGVGWLTGRWVAKLVAPACYGSSLGSKLRIQTSPKNGRKIGEIAKEWPQYILASKES